MEVEAWEEVWAEVLAEADEKGKITSKIMREVGAELGMKFDLHQTIGRLNTCGIINGPTRVSFRLGVAQYEINHSLYWEHLEP